MGTLVTSFLPFVLLLGWPAFLLLSESLDLVLVELLVIKVFQV